MNAIVTLTQADATNLQAALDTRLGYPKAAVDGGGGMHVPPAQSRTLTASAPIQHPTLGTWAVPQSPEIAAVVGVSVSLPVGATVQPLDATWFPVTAQAAQVQVG